MPLMPVCVYARDLTQAMVPLALRWAAMRFGTCVLPPRRNDSLQLAEPAWRERWRRWRKEIVTLSEGGIRHGVSFKSIGLSDTRSHAGYR